MITQNEQLVTRAGPSRMTLVEAVEQMKATCTHQCQLELLERVLNVRPLEDRPRPKKIPFTKRRQSLMQLRPRHLEKVDRIAGRAYYSRAMMHEFLLDNYDRLFGPLRRPRTEEVPSDQFRKSWMVSELLDQVEALREELEEEAAYRDSK